jgi:ABC-2 type transport system permease protein
MKNFFNIIFAEAVKLRRNSSRSIETLLSFLIWPILVLFTTYYAYQSFDVEILEPFGIMNYGDLYVFLLTGTVAYQFFWVMVQSAWEMSFERIDGTLEAIFTTPANRMAILFGRAFGSMIANVWMLVLFLVVSFVFLNLLTRAIIPALLLAFLLLFIASLIWGALLNAWFLFTRDSTFLLQLLDMPMQFFSGVKLPLASFPLWGTVISAIFPLTYCLAAFRAVINGQMINIVDVVILFAILVFLLALTMIVVRLAERRHRASGEFNFY